MIDEGPEPRARKAKHFGWRSSAVPGNPSHIHPDPSRRSEAECRLDFPEASHGIGFELVLPDAEYPVTLRAQFAARTIVAPPVPVNLLLPKARARLRRIPFTAERVKAALDART